MQDIFRDNSKTIKLYPSVSVIQDPLEKNAIEQEINPIPVLAIVTDLAFEKVTWAMPGIVTDNAKQIIIQKRDLSILLCSNRITVDGEDFEGWKVNGRLQYKTEDLYVRAYIYRKLV